VWVDSDVCTWLFVIIHHAFPICAAFSRMEKYRVKFIIHSPMMLSFSHSRCYVRVWVWVCMSSNKRERASEIRKEFCRNSISSGWLYFRIFIIIPSSGGATKDHLMRQANAREGKCLNDERNNGVLCEHSFALHVASRVELPCGFGVDRTECHRSLCRYWFLCVATGDGLSCG
jgi:hypothetical protein